MRISPDDGQLLDFAPETDAAPEAVEAPKQSASEYARSERVMAATVSVLAGEAPRGRELRYYEHKSLSPMHVQMVFDRADGMRPGDIAEKYGLTRARVSVTLNHPDAEYLLGEILGISADRVADPIERMKSFAHEMINTKLRIVRDTETPRALKNDIASDFLDRAGYGARKKLDVEATHSLSISKDVGNRLVSALDASRRVATVDYSEFLAPKLLEGMTPGSNAGAMTPTSQESLASGGHSAADNGASPDDLPVAAPLDDVKVEEAIAREEFEDDLQKRRNRRSA